MFAENIFANQNLSAKFAKIFSRENFPLYGILVHCTGSLWVEVVRSYICWLLMTFMHVINVIILCVCVCVCVCVWSAVGRYKQCPKPR